MRRLMQHELALVSGGAPTVSEGATIAGGMGAGYGANIALRVGGGLSGLAATAPTAAITVAGAAATGVAAAGYAGWLVGTAIHNALPAKTNHAIGGTIDSILRRLGRLMKAVDEIGDE